MSWHSADFLIITRHPYSLSFILLLICIAAEGIELQPLNGQDKTGDGAAAQTAPNWEAHDAVDVVILDGKKKRE